MKRRQFNKIINCIEDYFTDLAGEEHEIDDIILGFDMSEYRENESGYNVSLLLKDFISAQDGLSNMELLDIMSILTREMVNR